MATTKKSNFNEKLMQLQKVMGEFTWEKDGINRHQSYKYVTEKQYKNNFKKALQEVGLLWSMEETKHEFIGKISENMHLILVDFKGTLSDPETEEFKEYTFSGSGADTGDKALYKAYTGGLKYFLASNFLVAEDNDPENDGVEEKPKHVAPEKREEIKEGLIDKDGKASKMQINSLKKALKMLREVDPEEETFIAKIAEKTDGFTSIKKKACEDLILKISEMIEKAQNDLPF